MRSSLSWSECGLVFQLTVHALHRGCEDGHSWEGVLGWHGYSSKGPGRFPWPPGSVRYRICPGTVQLLASHGGPSLALDYLTPLKSRWKLGGQWTTSAQKRGEDSLHREECGDLVRPAAANHWPSLKSGREDDQNWAAHESMAPPCFQTERCFCGRRLKAELQMVYRPGPFPGLLDLWGGAGDLLEYRAALLASHGIASLALDYLTPKISMETGKLVDNEYFETAYRVLQQHPQVLGSRIAMLGLSFGCSVTLKMAAYSQVLKMKEMMGGLNSLLTILSLPLAGHLIRHLHYTQAWAGTSNQSNHLRPI
ncbi:acyl-coenzyme A thioesterase 4-like protein, partial [Lates japonicus]